jgi:hypothetical protein
MKQTIILLLLAFGMRAQSWQKFGEGSESGRAKHFWVCNIGTTLIGNEINKRINRPGLSCISAGAIMFGAGYLKEEIHDGIMKRGVKSKDDLFMNGWGCLTGMMVCRVVIDIKERKK